MNKMRIVLDLRYAIKETTARNWDNIKQQDALEYGLSYVGEINEVK